MWSWIKSFFSATRTVADCDQTTTAVLYASFEPFPSPVNGAAEDALTEKTYGSSLAIAQQPTGKIVSASLENVPPDGLRTPKLHRSAPRGAKKISQIRRFRGYFTEMAGYEARLLVAIHRRSLRSLAHDSAIALHRDLRRFSLTSQGQEILQNRPLPSLPKVRQWIGEARRGWTDLDLNPGNPQANLAR